MRSRSIARLQVFPTETTQATTKLGFPWICRHLAGGTHVSKSRVSVRFQRLEIVFTEVACQESRDSHNGSSTSLPQGSRGQLLDFFQTSQPFPNKSTKCFRFSMPNSRATQARALGWHYVETNLTCRGRLSLLVGEFVAIHCEESVPPVAVH